MKIEPLQWAADDLLAPEHAIVSKLIRQIPVGRWGVDLSALPAGQAMVGADREASARFMRALLAWGVHYDAIVAQIRGDLRDPVNWHQAPASQHVWPKRYAVAEAMRLLLRRKLPLTAADLAGLADWIVGAGAGINEMWYPVKAVVKSIGGLTAASVIEPPLSESLARLVKALHEQDDSELKKLAYAVEKLFRPAGVDAPEPAEAGAEFPEPPPTGPDPSIPALAGSPTVMVRLKEMLGIVSPKPNAPVEVIGPDRFPLRGDSPLHQEHAVLSEYLSQVVGTTHYSDPKLEEFPAGQRMLALDPAARGRMVLAAAERVVIGGLAGGSLDEPAHWQSRYASSAILGGLAGMDCALDRDSLFDLLLLPSALSDSSYLILTQTLGALIDQTEREAGSAPLTPGERHVLHRLRCVMVATPPLGDVPEHIARLTRLIGDAPLLALVPGEAWSDAVNDEFIRMAAASRRPWLELLKHAFSATGARPSAKWLKSAEKGIAAIGCDGFSAALLRWLPQVNAPRTIPLLGHAWGNRSVNDVLHEDHATILRGLAWMVPLAPNRDLVRALTPLALSAYRKVPGVGPRATKVGNAAIYALSQIGDTDALGQLAILKVRVKFGTAQKEIEKALNALAEKLAVPREDVEEMAVPAYGLEEVGLRRETFGEFTAELRVAGTSDVAIAWLRADGKPQKSVPAKVKSDFKDDLKDLQTAAKDIEQMLPAQAARIDSMFLQDKAWPLEVWRERYLNHPLVGVLARRLIWSFENSGATRAGMWLDGRLVDEQDGPVPDLPGDTRVRLWHPIGRPVERVLAWRNWLERHQVRQPFKQAHREVYLLTDAERNTRTYSNRFAAHIIRQHQFNALAALRGWRHNLRLMVDAEFPPASRDVPAFGLRVEFWVEGAGDQYGRDTNETGTFLRLATDQVRFYPLNAPEHLAHAGGGGYFRRTTGLAPADPIPLDQVPALAFSEIMRDVDLFVGVASVGNDPTWQDGGPDGRYRDYWARYAFGELSETARTRRQVLERLVPRLKIADRCTLLDRFLIVRGDLRTYKIHLGSGNIIMEPNDEYLCIVPAGRGGSDMAGGLFLPFEGDTTLSVILSKALLLAEDRKITDSTITRQIGKAP